MSQFAGLDFSDNEEEQQPKVASKKGGAKDTAKPEQKKDSQNKPKADNKPKDAQPSKPAGNKNTKPTEAPAKAPAAEGDAEVTKVNSRGGQPRGKDSRRSEKRREGDDGKKRTFDRRSGTGRGKEVSRGGRGPFGAGNVDQEAQEAEKNPEAAVAAGEVAAEDAGVEEQKAEPEPEDTTMSFDDYLRKREQSRLNSALLGTKAAEAPVQLAVKEEEAYIPGKNEKKTATVVKKDQRSTSKTQVLDVAFRFESAPVERKRDEQRGARGTGKPRQQSARKSGGGNAFNGGDFPSL